MALPAKADVIRKSRCGDGEATSELMELVYDRLRDLAAHYLRQGRRGHTLQATEIVHEAFVNLVGLTDVEWNDRAHFLGVAASAMRQVLGEYARRRGAQKRGGGWQRVPLRDTLSVSNGPELDLLNLDEALSRLGELHERQARVVECRFFSGMTIEEAASALGVSAKTVEADWYAARAWLNRELSEE